MKGVSVAKAGAPYEVVDDLEKPSPGPSQILIKSCNAAFNPVESFMQGSGTLVTAWPIVLGCDASGVVVEIGKDVKKFQKGDRVCGCTRLGSKGHGTFQEFFLMDEDLTLRVPLKLTLEEAATIGVGSYTAALGLVDGLGLTLPTSAAAATSKNEWIIILGGSGSVGYFAIQLAKLCGYKVLTSCSTAKVAQAKGVGADATINYRDELNVQLAEVEKITGGQFFAIYDSTAKTEAAAFKMFEKSKLAGKKFATTNDWSPMNPPADVGVYQIALGGIGRSDEDGAKVTKQIVSFIPHLQRYLDDGSLKPSDYEVVGQGFDFIPKGVKMNESGASPGKKLMVKLAEG